MSQSPQVPARQPAPDGVDGKFTSRNVFRRRVAIACGATAGVTFILAGLMAGQSVLPNVLDELRDRDLLPVHIAGTSASGAPGAPGAAGAESSRSSTAGSDSDAGSSPTAGAPGSPGTPGTPAAEGDAPNLVLPGGINLSDVLDDPTAAVDDTLDTAKSFVKEIVGQLPVSTTLPELPVSTTVPEPLVSTTLPELPVSTTLPELPVSTTLPAAPVSTTLPPAPVSTTLPLSIPTVPTAPATTVPAVLAPITNGLGL